MKKNKFINTMVFELKEKVSTLKGWTFKCFLLRQEENKESIIFSKLKSLDELFNLEKLAEEL